MKKFISFVMAAAMVASLVPATAFAATGDVKATAKVVDAWTRSKDTMENLGGVVGGTINVPELQLKVTSADNQQTGTVPMQKVTVTLDNAEFLQNRTTLNNGITVKLASDGGDQVAADEYSYRKLTAEEIEDLIVDYYYGNQAASILNGYVAGTTIDVSRTYTTSQKGSTAVANVATFGITAPATKGKTLAENRVTALTAVLTDHTLQAHANTYFYSDTNPFLGGVAGWYSTAADCTAYPGVTLEEATQKAITGALKDADGFDIVKDGAIVATTQLEPEAGWIANEKAKWAAAEWYAETVRNIPGTGVNRTVTASIENASDLSDDEITITVRGRLVAGDVISVDLLSTMDKASKNATVSVDAKMVTADDLAYVIVESTGVTASVKKTVKLAEEEKMYLNSNGLKIKETVLNSFADQIRNGDLEVSLKLSKGFEFVETGDVYVNGHIINGANIDGNEITFNLTAAMIAGGAWADVDEDGLCTLTITGEPDNAGNDRGLYIESTSAKSGTVGTITVKVGALDKVTVDVVEAVDYKVVMSVDEDEDVPVIYNGVNVDNDGITDDSDHETLEITLEETFPGAWSSRQGFDITVPDGVYVTAVDVTNAENFFVNGQGGAGVNELTTGQWAGLFADAYQNGDHKNFEFDKRVFDDVDVDLADDVATLTFKLTVVADPNFEGDVEIGFEGALVDTQSVVAAKFVAPYTVQAEQNDLKIDSRYTSIPTDIVVKEAADGLWDDRTAAVFTFNIEKGLITFEDDATFTVDADSELEIDDDLDGAVLSFEVTDSSDTAATVTISDMELFMERNIPAGEYGLELTTSMLGFVTRNNAGAVTDSEGYLGQVLYAPDADEAIVDDVTDYDNTVRADFINVITAPRDEDGFTTKITVPVGESYIIAGEVKVEIDTPAYINANGYTMLPLRAVAVALGIDNNSVLWDQSTRTATILYGNRVVSMQNGASVMYINGQAVATKAGVEITNDRTFLSLRDLGTAMNVTDISWDAATRTAYLNAGVTEEA